MGTDNNLQILQQPESAVLFNDVCLIIDQARRHVATYVNVEACLMNWHVGKRIKEDVLYNQRAEYGKQILKNLSVKLTERYGTGWGTEKLKHCVRSAYLFSEDDIMYAARTQLTWTHLRSLMSLKDSLERQFYMEDTGVSFEERRRSRNFILWTFGLTIFCAIFQWLFMYFTDGGETLRAYLKLTM